MRQGAARALVLRRAAGPEQEDAERGLVNGELDGVGLEEADEGLDAEPVGERRELEERQECQRARLREAQQRLRQMDNEWATENRRLFRRCGALWDTEEELAEAFEANRAKLNRARIHEARVDISENNALEQLRAAI